MPNYIHKETGEIKRFSSVRITWSSDMSSTSEVCLDTGESILDNYEFIPWDGEYNVKMKKSNTDGYGMR